MHNSNRTGHSSIGNGIQKVMEGWGYLQLPLFAGEGVNNGPIPD